MPSAKPDVKPVKLICGVMYQRSLDLDKVDLYLTERFGPIESRSKTFECVFTDYYEKEMGKSLLKQFYSFGELIMPDTLASIKNITNAIEAKFAVDGKRAVNLDPGYMEESKLVLASTKNFSHRIYLGDKIWGEVTLRYEKGEFVTHPWTYADYATDFAFGYFKMVRDLYRKELNPL